MKKGIEVQSAHDRAGNWLLKIAKNRGKLTIEDIREAAMEWEPNYYCLLLNCLDMDSIQYFDDDLDGDAAELYEADAFLEALGRVKRK